MPVVSKEAIKAAVEEAIKSSKKRNFLQSVELIIVFKDFDPKLPENRIRENIFLPKPMSKNAKVCVVADGDLALKAREVADRVLTSEDIRSMQGDRKSAKKIAQEYDWVLVRTDLMPLVGRVLGPALGPRGKAPVPVPPTANIEAIVKRYRNTVRIRTKDQPQVMCRIGTEDMDPEDLAENALAVLSTVEEKLKNPVHNIAKIYVKTTMGPAVEVKR